MISGTSHSKPVKWKQSFSFSNQWENWGTERWELDQAPKAVSGEITFNTRPPTEATQNQCARISHDNLNQRLTCHSEPQGSGTGGGTSRSYGVRLWGRFFLAPHTKGGKKHQLPGPWRSPRDVCTVPALTLSSLLGTTRKGNNFCHMYFTAIALTSLDPLENGEHVTQDLCSKIKWHERVCCLSKKKRIFSVWRTVPFKKHMP